VTPLIFFALLIVVFGLWRRNSSPPGDLDPEQRRGHSARLRLTVVLAVGEFDLSIASAALSAERWPRC
jgi:hypothetical protein